MPTWSPSATPHAATPRAVRVWDGQRDFAVVLRPGHAVVFGRSDRADVVIRQERVSRLHGMLWWHDGQWRYRDLGSANGSFVYTIGDFAQHEQDGGDLPVDGLRDGDGRPVCADEGVLLGSRTARIELLAEVPPDARTAQDPLLPAPGPIQDAPTAMFSRLEVLEGSEAR